VQDIENHKKVLNITYRYDTVFSDNGQKTIQEKVKVIDTIGHHTEYIKKYKTKEELSFNFFWKIKKKEIFQELMKFNIKYSNKIFSATTTKKSIYLKYSKVKYEDLFPNESFLKEINVYKHLPKNKNILLFCKQNKDFIYASKVSTILIHPFNKKAIYILSSVKRGATGEPHLITLDIFSENSCSSKKYR